ncbi:ankyrin repeat-containing domain protein [Aspergillus pseudonomiae]|uniref:Ankyrin repeat-containing domain protein n=1 Tax=Aspergillus pseudonomiae TaxID=1506151 RepID=A0A5N6I5W5_9EURO|nr:ankyrin repeat-containing domain protein [Aspergillus pseudonomiae]KAB8262062.1 ankyrin repeat-containing domain protein [Aspergillus pseudonomiae]KAE8402639.1 ankyrin repeat-containing domain protein [Aspergillus pseudonomiae]
MAVNNAFLHAATVGDATTIETEYLRDKSVLIAKDAEGRTALHLAALHKDVKVLELLLNYGIEPSIADNRGQTALHIAAELSSLPIVELLLQRGANWSIRDHDGNTPLSYAYQQYSLDVLSCFLQYTPASPTEVPCGLTPEIVLRSSANRKWTALQIGVNAHGR